MRLLRKVTTRGLYLICLLCGSINSANAEWSYTQISTPNGPIDAMINIEGQASFSFLCKSGDGPYAALEFAPKTQSNKYSIGWTTGGREAKHSQWMVLSSQGWFVQAVSTKADGKLIFDAIKRAQRVSIIAEGDSFSFSSVDIHEPMVQFINSCIK